MNDLPESARRVQHALEAAGIDARVLELPQSTRTVVDAAGAIGCDPAQIAKSLVFRRSGDDEPVLVIASGTNRVDETLVGRHVGSDIGKADADYVRARTGFAIGGVPPLAHNSPIETLIDEDLLKLEVIWAAAGTPRSVVSLTPQQLLDATKGRVEKIAE